MKISSLIPACAGMMTVLLFLCIAPAQSADYTFDPANCDFRMTFPEEPGTTNRCNPEKPTQCYKINIFNKVFALDSAIRVTITCNPAEDDMLQRYSGEVMEYTLKTMIKDNNVTEEHTGYSDYGDTKSATLLGRRATSDGTDKVYMAQLWISKNSVLTVEGELTGPASDDGDKLFTSIMKSIRLKSRDDKITEEKKEEKSKPK